jgi:autotransporter translocation and assembly factor TamB
VNTAQAKVQLDGAVQAAGRLRAPALRGQITLRKTTLYAEKGSETNVEHVELTDRDRLVLEERFGVGVGARQKPKTSLADSVDLDVTLKVGDNVWVRRHSDPIVALEMKGDVRARRPPGSRLDARGTLGIRTGRSYLSFLGRRFEILHAQVELPGPVDSASASIEAFYRPQSSESNSADIEVTAKVEIDASGAETNLQSEPYLDHASLLNYLATGQVQGGMGSNQAYGLAVGTALGAVGGAAGRSLGLDVVTVTTDAYGGQTLGAGSYVNPKLYLGFRQPVVQGKTTGNASNSGSTATEFEVEVEARRNLLLNLQGSSTQYRFLLRPRLGR